MSVRGFRDGRHRGDIAGAAEILVQRGALLRRWRAATNASGFSSGGVVIGAFRLMGGVSVSFDLRLHALKRDHHVQLACGFLA
jgi:hypothetical protein